MERTVAGARNPRPGLGRDGEDAALAWYRDHAGWWQTLVPDAERLYAD